MSRLIRCSRNEADSRLKPARHKVPAGSGKTRDYRTVIRICNIPVT